VQEEEYEDPPPLPPDNAVGRRSMMLAKERQKIVVKELGDRVAANQSKHWLMMRRSALFCKESWWNTQVMYLPLTTERHRKTY